MKKNSFVEGTFIATLAIVVTKILGMLYVIPFYSIIGTQGSALYSYAYNIYVMFLGISSAGIPSAMSKIVSEYDSTGQKEAKVRSFKIGVMIIGTKYIPAPPLKLSERSLGSLCIQLASASRRP